MKPAPLMSCFFSLKKWFNHQQKRETLRMKRNGMKQKINTSQQSNIHLNDHLTKESQPLQMNNTSVTHRNTSLYSTPRNVGMNCNVFKNDEIEITAVKKFDYKQNCEKTVRGFVVIQDENGICLLHEQ